MFDTGHTAFMLVATSLVMLMTPGLAFFYGGLVGRKNFLSIMIQSFVLMGVTTILWYAVGFSLYFSGGEGGIISNLDMAFLNGISPTTPFPITVAGYVNIHNDTGSNAYFQIDYPFMVGETQLSAFVGAAAGSKDNPDYYGTDNLQVINLGLGSTRTIKLSDAKSIPLNISFIVNPQAEIAYLLAGISL